MTTPLFAGKSNQYLYSANRQAVAAWIDYGQGWRFDGWLWDGTVASAKDAARELKALLASFPTMAD